VEIEFFLFIYLGLGFVIALNSAPATLPFI